jgi:beta-glucanase (GH16 family)
MFVGCKVNFKRKIVINIQSKLALLTLGLVLISCGSDKTTPQTNVQEVHNQVPVVTSTATTSASIDLVYRYTFLATDADNDSITFSATTLPAWLTFEAATGILSGSPNNNEVGEHTVTLVASDGIDEAVESFTITVVELPTVAAYEGYSGEYAGMTLAIDERFDEFNSEQWIKSTHTFYEQGCVLEEKGVQFSEGIMSLVVDLAENSKGYSCGEIRSIDRYRYGRLEARIKSPATDVASGYISSLFTYVFRPDGANNDDTSAPIRWREIDIEMEGGRPDKFQANYIYGDDEWEWWKTRSWGAYAEKIDIGPISEWRVYALEWTPDAIKWYIDGELVKTLLPEDLFAGAHNSQDGIPHTLDANLPEYAMGLYMNFWIPNDEVQDSFGGNKAGNVYPMAAQYDWFRYYSLDGY